MGYYPDMSNQAAAQSYFLDLVRQAISQSPVTQRVSGAPFYLDAGTAVGIPAGGSVAIGPNFAGRGVVAVFVTWNYAGGALANTPRVTLSGAQFSIFNDNAVSVNAFWLALGA